MNSCASLLDALAPQAGALGISRVLVDLTERRANIYSLDIIPAAGHWEPYAPAPLPVTDPVADVLQFLEPVHAVLPLFDYGWTLLVQGQLGEATRVLEAVVELAMTTNQPFLASAGLSSAGGHGADPGRS